MFKTTADAKPDADVAYLSAAIVRDAVANKFKSLFGRDPVSKSETEPMTVTDTKVPDIVLSGVDPDIVAMLKACAVESSKKSAADLPQLNNAVLLYTIIDDTPEQISLDAVSEYEEMDSSARDAVVHDAAASGSMNVGDNIAYISKYLSTIEIGVYADSNLFAEEFQYRLENAGGSELEEDKKVAVFDDLFNDLPGGAAVKETDARNKLLKAVGLQSQLPAGEQIPDQMKAPGPGSSSTSAAGLKRVELSQSGQLPPPKGGGLNSDVQRKS